MMSDVRIKLLPAGDWRRRLHGPYRIFINDVKTGEADTSKPTPYAEAAIATMLAAKPFPAPNMRTAVFDVDGWIVIGYSTDPLHVEAFDTPAWWGSEFGFALAESTGMIDPVELAIMESNARDLSDGDEWWQ